VRELLRTNFERNHGVILDENQQQENQKTKKCD